MASGLALRPGARGRRSQPNSSTPPVNPFVKSRSHAARRRRPKPRAASSSCAAGYRRAYLDHADCSLVAGWAWDALRPDEPLEVRITISNGAGITVAASDFRPDLLEHKKGNGRHGFVVVRPALASSAGRWRVDASFADSGVPLTGSPRTIVCPPQ